jgi:protein SCO1/2
MSADGPVTLSEFRGKLVMLYFGYTFCPDVCPATLADVATALERLGPRADDVQMIMVSVDPARDSPELLEEYVRHFDSRFIGVTGTEDEIASVATLYGVYYRAQEGTEATGYLIDHTATLIVVDREGRMKLIVPFGAEADAIADDLDYMLR